MSHYIFSGSLTEQMVEYLKSIECFEPMDVLVSQLDRSGVKKMLEYKEQGVVKSLFIDSGAYSVHSQGIHIDVDEYIDYVNGLDEHIIAVAQLDRIPGVFKQPKKPEDYVVSAEQSWENFLYMYPKMKSPEKLIPVYHYGEDVSVLKKMLEWKDENGVRLQYLGLSPANDVSVGAKDVYLKEMYDIIKRSPNPNIHTHLFGYTSLPGLSKFPWYTCDSVSHRLRAAYNKVFTNKWGTISFSKTREAKSKSDMSFIDTCDEATLKELTQLVESYGFTIDQMTEDSSARTAMDICEVQKYVREHPYVPGSGTRTRNLFKI